MPLLKKALMLASVLLAVSVSLVQASSVEASSAAPEAGDSAAESPPNSLHFADFPVPVSAGTLAAVDFDSHPVAVSFKTRFKALSGRTANFAGHFILLSWGCGSSCQQFSIVDVVTGHVFMKDEWSTSMGVCFRPDSALLIVNPGAQKPMRADSAYYHWDGQQLQLLWRGQGALTETCPMTD